MVGTDNYNISMKFFNWTGDVMKAQSWNGETTRRRTDDGNYATRTPDGGYLVVGRLWVEEYVGAPYEVALIKTDSEGEEDWVQLFPGTTNISETGIAAVALTNNSYVVLGRRETGDARIWLFKLAANHPPVADLNLPIFIANTNAPLTFDASGSTDRDGSVVLCEWDFGDGQTTNGMIVEHAYQLPGQYTIQLTVVDDQDAERSVSNSVFILGIQVNDAQHFTLGDNSLTNDPASDPGTYPPEGAALLLDWTRALGFHLTGTATSSTTRTIDVTFAETLPDDFTLYKLPGWTPVAYTLVDEHTLRVSLWVPAGAVDLTYVLADTHTVPTIVAAGAVAGTRLSLTFDTIPGVRYRVQHTPQLAPPAWTNVSHALAAGDPATMEYLDGSGLAETLFADVPDSESAFFRLMLESTSGDP